MVWLAAKFLLRFGLIYGLIYFLWKPFQARHIGLLSAVTERFLRLVDRPPLITSLTPQDNAIVFFSYLTGFRNPLASWNGENLHLYLVAALALTLAVPLRRPSDRLRLVLLCLVMVMAISSAICVVQIQAAAADAASTRFGITVHTPAESKILDWANRMLIMVGMLGFPAYVFFVSYLSQWFESPPAGERPQRGGSNRLLAVLSRRRWMLALPALALVAGVWMLAVATSLARDPRAYHRGWQKILDLNPDFAPAQVNVALHLEESGRLEEAIELYRNAVSTDPGLSAARYNLGNALRKNGRPAEAVKSYLEALELEPDHAAANRNLGSTLLDLRRPCEALLYLERCAQLERAYRIEPEIRNQLISLRQLCPASMD